MSRPAAVYRRSEIEVAADAVAAIYCSGLVARTSKMVQAMSRHTTVPVDEILRAVRRHTDGRTVPPRPSWTDPGVVRGEDTPPPPLPAPAPAPARAASSTSTTASLPRKPKTAAPELPLPAPRTHPPQHPSNHARYMKAHPTPDTRICSRCKQEKPLEAFNVKNPKTGNRASMCRDCMREYQRGRYLSVEAGRKLEAVMVRFVVTEGDACEGAVCHTCWKPMLAGQDVCTGDAMVRHAVCADREPDE